MTERARRREDPPPRPARPRRRQPAEPVEMPLTESPYHGEQETLAALERRDALRRYENRKAKIPEWLAFRVAQRQKEID